jgi:NifU-like protein involved in Fe-S cluster formation
MKYNEETLRYFETAERAGVLEGPGVFRGAAGSRRQGTWVQFDVQVRAGAIEQARFLAFACPHTLAAAGWVAEHAAGPLLPAALPVTVQQLSDRFAVPVEKRGRLLVVEDAWVAALSAALQR